MLLCAITDRHLLGEDEAARCAALVELARKWTQGGVDYIQIREKDLPPAGLLGLTRRMVEAVSEERAGRGGMRTKVLLNGPAAIALEAGADGVHLPGVAAAGAAEEIQAAYERAGCAAIVSRSCHSTAEAGSAGNVSLILFAPVFEKVLPAGGTLPGQGLAGLASACHVAGSIPVLALGGVTAENARSCVEAGAAGIAGIRLFLGDDWWSLRGL
jgi:thiamine-phosphate pyrophosphorylase